MKSRPSKKPVWGLLGLVAWHAGAQDPLRVEQRPDLTCLEEQRGNNQTGRQASNRGPGLPAPAVSLRAAGRN